MKKDNLKGRRFGRLTVLRNSGRRTCGKIIWVCLCTCGNLREALGFNLRGGHIRSCGCLQLRPKSNKSKARVNNLQGKRFGRLIVLKDSGKRIRGFVGWLCKCNCGNLVEVRSDNLKNGNTKSCGCLSREKARGRLFEHGISGKNSRLYRIWSNIKSRCYNPKAYGYKYHGRRGIIVCPEWKNGFTGFRNWALNNGYADNLFTIRIDKSGNYEPSNIQFLTKSESIKKQWREKKNLDYLTVRYI